MALKPFEQFLFTASVYYKVYDKKSLALYTWQNSVDNQPSFVIIGTTYTGTDRYIHYVAFASVKY
jgi:uncharacterized protein Usg